MSGSSLFRIIAVSRGISSNPATVLCPRNVLNRAQACGYAKKVGEYRPRSRSLMLISLSFEAQQCIQSLWWLYRVLSSMLLFLRWENPSYFGIYVATVYNLVLQDPMNTVTVFAAAKGKGKFMVKEELKGPEVCKDPVRLTSYAVGVNVFKQGEDPLLKPPEQYPEWWVHRPVKNIYISVFIFEINLFTYTSGKDALFANTGTCPVPAAQSHISERKWGCLFQHNKEINVIPRTVLLFLRSKPATGSSLVLCSMFERTGLWMFTNVYISVTLLAITPAR